MLPIKRYQRRILQKSANGSNRAIPNSVGVPPIPYLGAAYLAPAHEPFAVHGDPNDPSFQIPNIGLRDREHLDRLSGRMRLRQRLDNLLKKRRQSSDAPNSDLRKLDALGIE